MCCCVVVVRASCSVLRCCVGGFAIMVLFGFVLVLCVIVLLFCFVFGLLRFAIVCLNVV